MKHLPELLKTLKLFGMLQALEEYQQGKPTKDISPDIS